MFSISFNGFRSRHSTESALFKDHNDIALAVDAKRPVIVVLLDLTVASDAADHTVLLSRLNQYVGITGTACRWFTSYLNQSFSVMIGDLSLSCGKPQCSIYSIYSKA